MKWAVSEYSNVTTVDLLWEEINNLSFYKTESIFFLLFCFSPNNSLFATCSIPRQQLKIFSQWLIGIYMSFPIPSSSNAICSSGLTGFYRLWLLALATTATSRLISSYNNKQVAAGSRNKSPRNSWAWLGKPAWHFYWPNLKVLVSGDLRSEIITTGSTLRNFITNIPAFLLKNEE